jgi:hypothetical protein
VDAIDNVFVIMAHDESLIGIVDFYYKEANTWMVKGWDKDAK